MVNPTSGAIVISLCIFFSWPLNVTGLENSVGTNHNLVNHDSSRLHLSGSSNHSRVCLTDLVPLPYRHNPITSNVSFSVSTVKATVYEHQSSEGDTPLIIDLSNGTLCAATCSNYTSPDSSGDGKVHVGSCGVDHSSHDHFKHDHHGHAVDRFPVVVQDYERLHNPFCVCIWLFLACLAKIGKFFF